MYDYLVVGSGLYGATFAQQAKAHGFRILQLNAVVATNTHARHLYERIGFQPLGSIPNGFRLKSGQYETICPYYLPLSE